MGCSKLNACFTAGGGILRDSNSKWIGGFLINIGMCDAIGAELWAVLQGMTLAWDRGYRFVTVEVDSSIVVLWLNGKSECKSMHANLVFACLEVLKRDWLVTVTHVFRETNQVADRLANIALDNGY